MKTALELMGRTLLVFCVTIIMGTFFSAIYMTLIDFDSSATFSEYFFFGIFITGIFSLPTLLILFIGFFLIYKKCKNNTQKWKYIILLWLSTCYAPVILFADVLFNNNPGNRDFLYASTPYIFASFISIFFFTYYFDKKKPPVFRQKTEKIDDDILDAPF